MPELLTDEEIEAITVAAYTGGKGDPERDVRRLLMHIEIQSAALKAVDEFFAARLRELGCLSGEAEAIVKQVRAARGNAQ